MRHAKSLAYTAAVLNAVIVGLSFFFTKIALEHHSPADTLSYRFTAAFLVIVILFFFRRKLFQFQQTDKKNMLYLLLLACFYPGMFFSFQAFGLLYATSAEGGILMAFAPILITILAAFVLKERTNLFQFFFIILSVSGVLFIFFASGNGIGSSSLGLLLLFISCLSIAGYSVLARYLSISYSPLQLSFIMVGFGFVFFNVYSIGTHMASGSLGEFFSIWKSPTFLAAILYLGILSTLLTSFLSNYALSKLQAYQMSVFSNLSTVIAIFAGAVLLNEDIRWHHLVGTVIILAGVAGTNMAGNRRMPKED
ncbi:EamA family transporter [Bacillus lacus]|uniref:EamA family transporter n=1 Tax=Metabacillus lacus TaxID=1983721 RepID=A0A7X2J0H2_9BACI|nr:DMT family transporter [Metabacillus lacus]MRX73187.1 EamA family transporter [Metabacillus lacus]